MKIAVFGIGGVDGYFGGMLAKNPALEVYFIARGNHGECIQQQGLKIRTTDGDMLVHPAGVSADPMAIGVCDVVLVCVKSWQLTSILEGVQSLVHERTVVLPLLNGLSAMDVLAKHIGKEHVLGGLCRIVAEIVDCGEIGVQGLQPTVVFGELDGKETERVGMLRSCFEESGVAVEVPEDIMLAVWKKFMFIATLSGVGAYVGVAVGELRNSPESRNMLEGCLKEIQMLAEKKGVALSLTHVEKTMSFIDSLDPGVTASMQRDILSGRPSELEGQTGTVVKMARELGVDVPIHQQIYNALLPLEKRARGRL